MKPSRFLLSASFLLLCGVFCICNSAHAQDTTHSDFSTAPPPLNPDEFAPLVNTSPFTRVLSLSETYALRGVANLGDQQVATLYNKENKKTIIVTAKGDNEVGLSLVTVNPATALEEVTAKVALAGDEAEVRYDEKQINFESRSGSRPGTETRHHSADHDRFTALPKEQQDKLRAYIGYVIRSYPNMSREERGNLIRGAMTRLSDGQDITIPTSSTSTSTSTPQKAADPRGAKGSPASTPPSSAKGGHKGRRR